MGETMRAMREEQEERREMKNKKREMTERDERCEKKMRTEETLVEKQIGIRDRREIGKKTCWQQ